MRACPSASRVMIQLQKGAFHSEPEKPAALGSCKFPLAESRLE
jgi:hypothetical protein